MFSLLLAHWLVVVLAIRVLGVLALISLVILVIIVILALLVRSLTAPLSLLATTALSAGTALGLTNLVSHALLGQPLFSIMPVVAFVFPVVAAVLQHLDDESHPRRHEPAGPAQWHRRCATYWVKKRPGSACALAAAQDNATG